jgi:3-hydroxyisobutyrate dehydrogenase-like beta-hydroxyacid dehydrogenase
MQELRNVGFVGFGAMAQRMAARLRDAGHTVSAFDPAEHGEEAHGFKLVQSAAALARNAGAVIVSVPADAALHEATEGAGGVLEGARKGLLLINTSTVSPGASVQLAKAAAIHGIRFVEAPVSGSTPEAESGKLVVLAGGSEDDVAHAAPILDVMARKTVHAGPAGLGTVLKLVINGVMALGTAALAEGLAYGVQAGLDRDTLIDTLKDLILVSEHHRRKLEMTQRGDYPSQFPTRLLSKDMGLLLSDAGRRGVPMASMAAASQLFALATREHGDEDYAAAISTMEALVRTAAASPHSPL